MVSAHIRSIGRSHGLSLSMRFTPVVLGVLASWSITLEAVSDTEPDNPFTLAVCVAHTVNLETHGRDAALKALGDYSAEMLELAEVTSPVWHRHRTLVAGESLIVEQNYRGWGIGPLFAADVLSALGGDNFAAILLGAPLDSDDLSLDQWSSASGAISSAWQQAGFIPVFGGYHYLTSDTFSVRNAEEKVRGRIQRKTVAAI